jgi:hypothetical protein
MLQELRKGSLVIDDDGVVAVITRTNVRSDHPDNQGRIHTYHTGTVLRSGTNPVGSKFAGQTLRVVCHIEDLLRIGEKVGLDLATPAEVPDSQLSEVELLRKRVTQLEQAAKQPSI